MDSIEKVLLIKKCIEILKPKIVFRGCYIDQGKKTTSLSILSDSLPINLSIWNRYHEIP